jgi:hypothetical protein
MIYTFYSFKGGVGRSMALANVAELLARRGLRVLMVDFDLEAPGLERFFESPERSVAELEKHRGVIDLLISYKQLRSLPVIEELSAIPENSSAAHDDFPYPVEPLREFVLTLANDLPGGGQLLLLPAGQRGGSNNATYAESMRAFDWDEFYRRWNGEAFFDWFREEAKTLADVVLVDSRTGITEMSGICTFHLADVVVMFVAPNQQNLAGCLLIAESLRDPALIFEGRRGRPLQLLPVPSRVENSESELLDEFATDFDTQLGHFLPSDLSFEKSAFVDLMIPYVPYYAYRESIAVREAERPAASEIVSAYSRLCKALVELSPRTDRIYRAFHDTPTQRGLGSTPQPARSDTLRLQVTDWARPSQWRWVLSGPAGEFLADHAVDLDDPGGRSASALEGFTDLEWFLKWRASVDRRLEDEAELLAEVGDWIAKYALGPAVAEQLAQRPGTVHLVIPPEARGLANRPWQAARVNGRTLAASKVTFVTDTIGRAPTVKRPVGDRLRMLAVFSVPDGTAALNLRRERYALERLVDDIANAYDRAVDLRVVQYGATRKRLEDALLEQEGWDILHLSGHGLPGGLVLEDDTGGRDFIDARQLVDMVEAASQQLKLITLFTCESGARTAQSHLALLGLLPNDDIETDGSPLDEFPDRLRAAEAKELSALATALVDRVDAAVLAMRYPVADDFAVGLSEKFYDLVLGKGQPVARALGLALPRVLPATPSAGVPAVSVATPALFGARALGLTLQAPIGSKRSLSKERVKLTRFPDQPNRFVGRVGAMARASTALAPRSGIGGVLFHGMAGGGKTACALELAYTHQDAFQLLVWHQAPLQEKDITSAFTNLALDLEAQIPGLRLLHLADDVAELTGFLPRLTEFLQNTRVLLVLDNLESLLTTSGGWRDKRWRLLLDAITVPTGSSRVIATSRTRPDTLPAGLRVEPVHALSLPESVLLAREWPHLRALLDTPDTGRDDPRAGRGLAARVLRVVQGHPKLIELADGQAADRATLAARLDQVDQTWLTRGVRLQDFLEHGESQASDQDYYQALDTWTRAATNGLPEPSAVLFTVLAGLEDADRIPFVLDAIWPELWTGLGHPDPAPAIEEAAGPLLAQALVALEHDPDSGEVVGYRIHPVIAEAARTRTPPDTAVLVDTTAAEFWQSALRYGRDREAEGAGGLILHAASAAAPYLARGQQWATLASVLGEVLLRDGSPDTAAALLPFLHAAAQATEGTDYEIECGFSYARALTSLRPAAAEIQLRRLLELSYVRDDHETASVIAGQLVNHYRDAGRFEEALALVDQIEHAVRSAGQGPWSQLIVEVRRLQIRRLQGNHQQVLDAVDQLRERMAILPDPPDQPETIAPWNVRETILDTGVRAARDLNLWQRALDLSAEIGASKRARGATDREIAFSRLNDYEPLRALGRLTEARTLLMSCKAVFEAHHDITNLGKTLGALADIEDSLGHSHAAISLQRDAIRLAYTSSDINGAGTSHHNLANYLERYTEQTTEAWGHRLAAALIAYQTGSGQLLGRLTALAQLVRSADTAPPASFDQVCAVVDQIDGVHLADLIAQLPTRAPDGQAAMAEVLTLAAQLPEQAADPDRHLRAWAPVISALAATITDQPTGTTSPDGAASEDLRQAAGAFLTKALDLYADTQDWAALAAALRRVQAGERDPTALSAGLDEIDAAILHRALAAVDGSDPIDPTLWAASGSNSEDSGSRDMTTFLPAVVAAAHGDPEAATVVGPTLDHMSADPDVAALAAALQAIVAGDRDRARLTYGLDTDSQTLVTAVLGALTGDTTPRERTLDDGAETDDD